MRVRNTKTGSKSRMKIDYQAQSALILMKYLRKQEPNLADGAAIEKRLTEIGYEDEVIEQVISVIFEDTK